MVSAARVKATTKCIKTRKGQFVCRCHNERDKDVIDYLEGCDNVDAEIKRLVRQEISKNLSMEIWLMKLCLQYPLERERLRLWTKCKTKRTATSSKPSGAC